MPLRIQDAGTLREIKRLTIREGGLNRRIRTLKVMHGGTLRTVAVFADPLTVTVSPTEVYGVQGSNSPVSVTTNQTTASPVGGLAPYTYAWSRTGGSEGTVNSPTMATTSFTNVMGFGTVNADFTVTVTDAGGATASATVAATFENVGGGLEP